MQISYWMAAWRLVLWFADHYVSGSIPTPNIDLLSAIQLYEDTAWISIFQS